MPLNAVKYAMIPFWEKVLKVLKVLKGSECASSRDCHFDWLYLSHLCVIGLWFFFPSSLLPKGYAMKESWI